MTLGVRMCVLHMCCVCECTYIRAYACADVFAYVCTYCWMYIMVVRLAGLHPGRLGGMFKGCLAASKWPRARVDQKWDDLLKFLPGTAIHSSTRVQHAYVSVGAGMNVGLFAKRECCD